MFSIDGSHSLFTKDQGHEGNSQDKQYKDTERICDVSGNNIYPGIKNSENILTSSAIEAEVQTYSFCKPDLCLSRMLQPYKKVIESTRIILASQSPRRVDIMKVLRIPVEVVPSPFDEENNRPDIKDHVEFAIWTAQQKAKVVAEKMKKESDPPRFVIGADSIVTLGGKLYGKPENDDDARETLKALSGQIHNVITGVSLIEIKGDTLEICDFAETTEVKFTTLDSETIDAYIATGEHKGKAGAYGIQEMGGSFVEHIKGDYYNVVGLPVHRFAKELIKLLKQ